jgi:acyl-CoA thioesterase FadM
MSLEEFPLQLPRNAFNPRDRPRAGDVWRMFQDAAVIGSSRRGWTPRRYRDEGCAFIVRGMTVAHHAPTEFGDALVAKTWVSTFKREMMSARQVRITGPQGLVAAATQRWVHVTSPEIKPSRAAPALLAAIPVVDVPGEADVTLPAWDPVDGEEHGMSFAAWYGWMDPLAHANHPQYVDWADEALARRLAGADLDPFGLVPVAEELTWRSGVVAPEVVTVRTRVVGVTEAGVVCAHRFLGADERPCAEGTTVRAHDRASRDQLSEALGAG